MTPRGADEHFEALVRRGFIVVVRTRRDGSRVIRYALHQAHNANTLTEAHRQRIRAAWRALDGKVRWSDDDRMVFNEATSVQ
jgi:hypothetical protein